MKIRIVTRSNAAQWGGDIAVINQIISGLNAINFDASIISGSINFEKNTKYIITNTCLDQRHLMECFIAAQQPYYCLPFHEDFRNYFVACIGMYNICRQLLDDTVPLAELEQFPEIINYAELANPPFGINNRMVLQNAASIFPSSMQEEATIKRDSPKAKTNVIRFPTDVSDRFYTNDLNAEFLNDYGLKPGYILQVGRLEVRKNQIATVLASRDIPVPVVFIATRGYSQEYEQTFIELIRKYRKYPTYIISENIEEFDSGTLHIRRMKNSKKLEWSVLQSAYQNAAVNCHPAFYELPGLTYIESIQLGIKTIVSRRASVSEYLNLHSDGVEVYSVEPGDLLQLRQAILDCLYGSQSTIKYKIPEITNRDYANNLVRAILLQSASSNAG